MKVNVTLIAVSVRYTAGAPQFVGLQVGDAWPTAQVDENARAAAAELQGQLTSEIQHVMTARKIKPSRVTFKDAGDTLNLIYTLALPIPMGDLDTDGSKWVPLVAAATKHADAKKLGSGAIHREHEYSGTVLEWWKEELEEEAGVFAFLPEHFTARQARDIYSAIWGYEQDVESFASWSGIGPKRTNGVLNQWIEPESLEVGELVDQFVDAICQASGSQNQSEAMRSLAHAVARNASERTVGLDSSSDLDSGGVVPRSALFSAAALVAYQVSARGPKPAWFRQFTPGDTGRKLENLYTPRPTWAYAPTN